MNEDPPHGYDPIGDYGLIGDGCTAALVNRYGSIDWCCWPAFDSPAIFCRLLDQHQGGFWQISPAEPSRTARRYIPDTNVLATTFETATGIARLTDFMRWPPDLRRPSPVLCRLVEVISGRMTLHVRCRPTPDFARATAHWRRGPDNSWYSEAGSTVVAVSSSTELEARRDTLEGELRLQAGGAAAFLLASEPTKAPTVEQLRQWQEETGDHWRDWVCRLTYAGPLAAEVKRSALVLKLMFHEGTGAMIAAPTCSLPERIDGSSNWDYRYTWLRDAAMALDVLQRLGCHSESERFFTWLQNLRAPLPLQPVYTLRGDPCLPEHELPHLDGYKGSRPVRVGNAAARQMQLDTAGHVLDAVELCYARMPRPMDPDFWQFLAGVADHAAEAWPNADESIWETRLGPRQFVHSKLMAWVALDRALRLAERMELRGHLSRWREQRAAVRAIILQDGYSEKAGAFTGTLNGTDLDAAALLIPLVGFLPATDQRMESTLAEVRKQLERDGLVFRNAAFATGEKEGAFLACSFWLCDLLAMRGEREEARKVLNAVLTCANDLGLLAEQASPSRGALLGNFPQSLSHLGLIRSALLLADADRDASAP